MLGLYKHICDVIYFNEKIEPINMAVSYVNMHSIQGLNTTTIKHLTVYPTHTWLHYLLSEI